MKGSSAPAHLFLTIVSAFIFAALSSVLFDGRSVIVLKTPASNLPVVTNPAIVNASLSFLAGPTYGVGLHHDSAGRYWTDVDANYGTLPALLAAMGAPAVLAALPTAISDDAVKHPVEFLQCKDLQTAGITAMVLGFIGVVVSFLMVVVHGAALAGYLGGKLIKLFCVLVWIIFVAAFLAVVIIGYRVYGATWKCDNPVIPTLKLDDSFDLSYAIPLAVAGLAASAICVLVASKGISSSSSPSGSSSTSSSSSS